MFRILFFPAGLLLLIATSCREASDVYSENNTEANGGFQKVPLYLQETAPDMILIEGGSFGFETGDSLKCRSFYISRYEESNEQYLAYLTDLKNYYSESTYLNALPDTLVWQKEKISQSEKTYLTANYLRNPDFAHYPVVGLSPEQIQRYASWKTDRINEFILIREGIIDYTKPTDSSDIFNTRNYFENVAEAEKNPQKLIDLEPKGSCWGSTNKSEQAQRRVHPEDGILLPAYRLPYFHEWSLAGIATGDEKFRFQRTPPETDFDKYNRNIGFDFLKIHPVKSAKNQPFSAPETVQNIGRVYDGEINRYEIYGLYSGVSELVQLDSLSFGVAGGNWRKAENFSAIYSPSEKKYRITSSLKNQLKEINSADIYGFRLAMDFIMPENMDQQHFRYPHELDKRRKGR